MSNKDDKVTVTFNFERETKGAVRFQETDQDGNVKTTTNGGLVGTLYLRKSGLPNGIPKQIDVDMKLHY